MDVLNGHLDRAAILGQTRLPIMEVEVPEWGGKVFIRVMTAGERDRFESKQRKDEFTNLRARTVAACVCDSSGNLLFTEADIPELTKLHAKALDRIFEKAIPFNGIGSDDIAELKKNSDPTMSEDSSSSSPAVSVVPSPN